MAYDEVLAARVRAALADRPALREVRMFGGLSFMVDGAMVVNVRGDGDLLVRVDPARSADLQEAGARQAEMAGRDMGPSWLAVAPAALVDDDALAFWLAAALEFNARQ